MPTRPIIDALSEAFNIRVTTFNGKQFGRWETRFKELKATPVEIKRRAAKMLVAMPLSTPDGLIGWWDRMATAKRKYDD